jgi:oligopeptide transport system substrate-binding protein
VDNGDDAPTIDPTISQDTTSSRVLYDLFEGLTSFDQNLKVIPGLAQSWDLSSDAKTYTFHLRPNLKFSDGTPITAKDVVFTWQRLVDPKTSSPYNFLGENIVGGKAIIDGKAAPTTLAVKALDKSTVQITLVHPDASFLSICSMPNVGIVSQANITKFGQSWSDAKHMVTSGAYSLKEWVVQGYILVTRNDNYYDAKDVAIKDVKFMPIVDTNSSYSQYQSGGLDITYSLPVDQYKAIKAEYPNQIHTVTQEGIYYYDLNMTLPKFKNNLKLRQALSMAVDRQILVNDVLGQGQQPLYSYATSTIEGGKFAGLDYAWAKEPRAQQIAEAKKLFTEAGYGPNHPLQISISYNTLDSHKKIALAVGAMWQQTFGASAIQVTSANQEWKTFLKARNMANYDVARDGWVADYDSVDAYTPLFICNGPQDNSKTCNPAYDKLINQAQNTPDANQRVQLTREALQTAMQDYSIIPLYQYTYFRLVKPYVKNYDPTNNHLDHVMSKWYRFN